MTKIGKVKVVGQYDDMKLAIKCLVIVGIVVAVWLVCKAGS